MRKPVDYKQYDSRWANKMYNCPGNANDTIKIAGCGPTCTAMVVASLKDSSITPADACQWAMDYGYRVVGGTTNSYFVAYLKAYGIEKYISYELGLISDYTYYTGIIFQGYTYGTGEPIVKGGRYDKLLSHFGKDAAAIGFAIVVDQLMAALSRQDIDVPVIENSSLIVFEEAAYHAAIKRSMELRRDGVNTQMVLKDKNKTKEDYASYAVDNRINRVEFIEE